MLFGLMVQSAIDLIDEGMFNVAMPSIQEEYGLQIEFLSLVIAVRYMARIGLMPIYGFVGDRFGKKHTFVAGLSIFVLGAIISFLSPSILWLVIGRILQGMGGGILPLAMAMISDHFPSERRGQILGFWNASAPLGVILGPPIGGLIIETFGWKAIFILSGVGSLIALIFVIRLVPVTRRNNNHRTSADWLGATCIFTFTTALLMATTSSGVFPFGSPVNFAFWGMVILALALLIWNMSSKPDPMIRLAVVKNRRLIIPSIAVTFRMFSLGGTVFIMVLYLANVFGKSPSAVGIFIIAHSLPIFLFVPIGGLIADRWSSRKAAVLGMLIQTVGMLWLSLVDPTNNEPLLLPGMFLGGLGAGLSLTPFTKGAVASLDDENVGLAAGLFNMIRFAGVAASAPLMGLILAAGFDRAGGMDTVPEPYQYGFRILTVSALIGVAIASRIPTSPIEDNEITSRT